MRVREWVMDSRENQLSSLSLAESRLVLCHSFAIQLSDYGRINRVIQSSSWSHIGSRVSCEDIPLYVAHLLSLLHFNLLHITRRPYFAKAPKTQRPKMTIDRVFGPWTHLEWSSKPIACLQSSKLLILFCSRSAWIQSWLAFFPCGLDAKSYTRWVPSTRFYPRSFSLSPSSAKSPTLFLLHTQARPCIVMSFGSLGIVQVKIVPTKSFRAKESRWDAATAKSSCAPSAPTSVKNATRSSVTAVVCITVSTVISWTASIAPFPDFLAALAMNGIVRTAKDTFICLWWM